MPEMTEDKNMERGDLHFFPKKQIPVNGLITNQLNTNTSTVLWMSVQPKNEWD